MFLKDKVSENFNFITEIVGTKDYRKPEWVSEMEEMKQALEGKVSYYSYKLYKIYANYNLLSIYTLRNENDGKNAERKMSRKIISNLKTLIIKTNNLSKLMETLANINKIGLSLLLFAFINCFSSLKRTIITVYYAMPSFVTDPRNVRSVIGDKAKFKLTFSGHPPPGISRMIFRMSRLRP